MSEAIYSARIKASAAKALRRIQPAERQRLVDAIDRLAYEPLSCPQNGGVPLCQPLV